MTGSPQERGFQWWTGDDAGRHVRALRMLNTIRGQQTSIRRAWLLYAALYRDIPTLGLGPYAYAVPDPSAAMVRLNLVKAAIDTYVSMISRNKPKPMAITSGGDWSLQKRAKGLNRWWEAKADESEFQDMVAQPCVRDSAVWGNGWVKVYEQDPDDKDLADVGFERRFPWQVTVDDAEAQQGMRTVRNLFDTYWYDREVLAGMFPKLKAQIRDCPRFDEGGDGDPWSVAHDSTADLIAVHEGYHRRSSHKAKDGRRCIFIANAALAVVPFEDDELPFLPLWRATPQMGIHGTPIPQELLGLQASINQDMTDIEESQRLICRPKWMVPEGSQVLDAQFDDDIGSIIRFAGQQQPTVYTPQAMSPEVYQHLWAKFAKGFEIIGLSAQQSSGQVDKGITGSGASIRASTDLRDGRMYEAQDKHEKWHIQVANRAIDVAKRVANKNPKYASVYQAKTYIEVVKFADVDMDRDQYRLRVLPMSSLSSNPAQRLAQLKEMYADKVIDLEAYRSMLDYPDLESETNLLNAPRELAMKLTERFLDADDPEADDVYIAPQDGWPLEQLKMRFQYRALQAQLDGAPEENLKLLWDFIDACDALLERGQGAPPPPGGIEMAPGGQAPMLPEGAPPGPPEPAGPPGQMLQ